MKVFKNLVCISMMITFVSCSSVVNKQSTPTSTDQIPLHTMTVVSTNSPQNVPATSNTPTPISTPTIKNTPTPVSTPIDIKTIDPDGDGFVNFRMKVGRIEGITKIPVDKIIDGDISIWNGIGEIVTEDPEDPEYIKKIIAEQIKKKLDNGYVLNDDEKKNYLWYLMDTRKDVVSLNVGVREVERYGVYEWTKAHVLSYYCNKPYFDIITMRDSGSSWAEIAKKLDINYDIIPSEYKRRPYEE